MKLKFIIATLLLAIAAGQQAEAQRTANQTRRIRHGVRNGELTRAETANLATRERAIRREKRIAKSDGVVTPAERRDIRRDERRTSRAIYRKKHNRRDRN